MGNRAVLLTLALVAASHAVAGAAEIDLIRSEINSIETELLQAREYQNSAESQLKKIRRLLALQQKELKISQLRIKELGSSMDELSVQKKSLLEKIEAQKHELRRKLSELHKLTDSETLDASWLRQLDVDNQKSYFLRKTLGKDLGRVAELKRDAQAALALELRILEEKNKLDYSIEELRSQSALLTVNEDLQKEILRTNRVNRLETMRRFNSLKSSERELEKMIASIRENKLELKKEREEVVDVGFSTLKGKLPFPVEGPLLSSFGKSYNAKTNLLTFQKGITVNAASGSSVKAIASGKVVFAGPLKNYGKIVIVEHSGKFYSLYGQLGLIAIEHGAQVRQSEAIGKTSDDPFYFEIRDKNVAINPLQWLGNGSITLSKQ